MMNRSDSMDRRYSLSFNTSLANRAESTKLNQTNSSFRWGSSPSRVQRSNSTTHLINLDDSVEKPQQRSARKVDPRVMADVQSKGLASRILKYHENGSRLNRSKSAHNLCSKPGQFPVVTLQKKDLPYRATKQNVSMTRISPPEKSMFYGNTLSSLLRSNSVVALQRSDEDISHENRPILHPPPTESDLAPTRSVLDVLKEISRKRINSDDDPNTKDTSKKNRLGSDLVDIGNNDCISSVSHSNAMAAHCFKRQRDVNYPYKGDVTIRDINTSPEQAKKRLCGYNNDITSSLSSSAKRKPIDNKRSLYQLNQTMPNCLETYDSQKVKMPKRDDNITSTDKRFLNLASEQCSSEDIRDDTPSKQQQTITCAVPQRSKSEPLQAHELNGTRLTSLQPINKPRLTLFNKDYDVDATAQNDDDDDGNDIEEEDGECAGIQFVKPKKIASSGLKNPLIERVQKSKLALMLSGLRGELYSDGSEDALDSPINHKPIEKNQVVEIKLSKPSNDFSANKLNDAKATIAVPNVVENAVASVGKPQSPNKTSSPLVGLKLTPQKSMAGAVETQKSASDKKLETPTLQGFTNNSITDITKTFSSSVPATTTSNAFVTTTSTPSIAFNTLSQTATTNQATTPKELPTFSFGQPAGTSTTAVIKPISTTTNTQLNTPAAVKSFNFGSNDLAQTNAINNNASSSTSMPASQATNNLFSTTNSATLATAPKTNSAFSAAFSFGAKPTGTTSTTPQILGIQADKSTTAAAPTFSFGTTPQSNPASSTASAPAFSFGTTAQTNPSSSTANTTAGFSFAPSTTTVTANVQNASASTFSTNKPTMSIGNAFAFGGASNKDALPTYGSLNANLTPAAPSTLPTFNQPSTLAPPSFGSPAPSTTSNIFGSPSITATPTFAGNTAKPIATFGSVAGNQAPTVIGTPNNANNLSSNNFASTADKPNSSSGGFAFGTGATNTFGNASFSFNAGTNPSNSLLASSTSNPASIGQSNTFTFNSNINEAEKKNSTNIFGSVSSAPSDANVATGFSFGSNAATNVVQKPTPSFSFGAANNSATSPPSAGGFSFAAAKPIATNNTAPAKPFSFGSTPNAGSQNPANSNISQSSSNIFGTASKTAAPAFNFGASPTVTNSPSSSMPTASSNLFAAATTTNNPSSTMTTSSNNLFAPPPSLAAGSNDRPIRRATRRLQK